MNKQFFYFLVVGLFQYFLDTSVFSILILYLDTEVSNIISRMAGAVSGFYLNGVFTFRKIKFYNKFDIKRIGRFFIVWATMTIISTLLINKSLLFLGNTDWLNIVIIKLGVEFFLVILSFTLQKFFVYRS